MDIEGVDDTLLSDTLLGNTIDSDIGLSITIDNLRVFINKTLSILSILVCSSDKYWCVLVTYIVVCKYWCVRVTYIVVRKYSV